MCRISVSVVGTFHHQFQKPELVSGFFTSAHSARTGGASRLCLASVTPHISPFLALFGLSVLQFYLLASRACARSLPVLMRVSGRLVVLVKWLPPATEEWKRGTSSVGTIWQLPAFSNERPRICSTLKSTGRANATGRPERLLADRSVLGCNVAGSRPSDSKSLERPLAHHRYSRTRPNPAGHLLISSTASNCV